MENGAAYKLADTFFFVFHIALILFNLFGWIPKRIRKWNLIALAATAFSWIVLGFFYGFGYCFLTDWHWQIREKLGYSTESNSYIHFLLTDLTRISMSEKVVDACTAIFFFAAFAASVYVNIRDKRANN